MSDTITINFRVSDKANIHSGNKSTFEVDRAEWEAMDNDARFDYVMLRVWEQDMLEITFDGQDDE